MNEIYITITVVITLYCIIQLGTGAMDDNGFRGFSIFILTPVAIIMLALSVVTPIGKDIVEVYPATNTKVGNELFIQAMGVPTQIVTDIKFIDQQVQIRKIKKHNAWGGGIATVYQPEVLIKTEL